MKQTIQTDENGTEITTVHLWRGLHPGELQLFIIPTLILTKLNTILKINIWMYI